MIYHLIGAITNYGSSHVTDTHRPTTKFPPAFPALCYCYGDRHGESGDPYEWIEEQNRVKHCRRPGG